MQYSGQLTIIECPSCSMPFGISETFERKMRKTHGLFYCPAGHYMSYHYETEEEKYKRLYEKKKNCCEIKTQQLKTARASYHGLKGYVSKLKKQIGAGVNPDG